MCSFTLSIHSLYSYIIFVASFFIHLFLPFFFLMRRSWIGPPRGDIHKNLLQTKSRDSDATFDFYRLRWRISDILLLSLLFTSLPPLDIFNTPTPKDEGWFEIRGKFRQGTGARLLHQNKLRICILFASLADGADASQKTKCDTMLHGCLSNGHCTCVLCLLLLQGRKIFNPLTRSFSLGICCLCHLQRRLWDCVIHAMKRERMFTWRKLVTLAGTIK